VIVPPARKAVNQRPITLRAQYNIPFIDVLYLVEDTVKAQVN